MGFKVTAMKLNQCPFDLQAPLELLQNKMDSRIIKLEGKINLLQKEVIKNVKSETETSTQIETSDESSNRAGKKMSLTVFYRNLRKY
jgi:hypothetical protein